MIEPKDQKTTTVAITLPKAVLQEIEENRGYDNRSHFILMAVSRYLRELERERKREQERYENENENENRTAITATTRTK